MNITKGIKDKPIKAVIYGPEGIGKSTLASKLPNPLFLDIEKGTSQLNTQRIDTGLDTWEDFTAVLDEVIANPELCDTIVIDTADAAETLLSEHLCRKLKKESLSQIGYGAGYAQLADEYWRFLKKLDKAIENGVNVVLCGHSFIRTFNQPDEIGNYDRYEPKLQKRTAAVLKEWCDMLLFINYKTELTRVQGRSGEVEYKAGGGSRVIYTTHHPAWDAKNRFGLPEELPLGEPDQVIGLFPKKGAWDKTEDEFDGFIPMDDNEPPYLNPEKPRKKKPSRKKDSGVSALYPEGDEGRAELRFKLATEGVKEEDVVHALLRSGIKTKTKLMIGKEPTLDDFDDKFLKDMVLGKWDQFKSFLDGKE